MVQPDKFGRTWKGRKIVWLRLANCSREAHYKWITVNEDGKHSRKLVFDKKNGMCDKYGNNVRETLIETVPALEGKIEGTWDQFPNTDDANDFKKTLTFNGYATAKANVKVNANINITDINDFDNEYIEEEIMVY